MNLDITIAPVLPHLRGALQEKLDNKTKPIGSLGKLESLALKISSIQNTLEPSLNLPTLLIFAGDHGVVESGVSAYPQTVTAQMVVNFLAGGAAVNIFASQNQLELLIVDAGVNATLPAHPKLIDKKIAKGTRNFISQPAMTINQCLKAMENGAELVLRQYSLGCNCIGFGEMGIGNYFGCILNYELYNGLAAITMHGHGCGIKRRSVTGKTQRITKGYQVSWSYY